MPNSEVVTNIALGASLDRLALISFSLALDASESNSLSIAGRDFNPSWNRLKVTKRGTGDIETDSSLLVENKRFSIRLR